MLQSVRRTSTLLLLLLCVVAARADAPTLDQLLAEFPRGELRINTPDARQHRFLIWLATTDAHRAQGLMFVRALPPDAGMLFIYSRPATISMWMKNTFIPLDMLFIKADGRIAQVVANTTPHSLETIRSQEDVVAVLELNAGTAQRLGIRRGAIVDRSVLQAATHGR